MSKLNIGNDRMISFWNTYKCFVHKQIMETRSSRIMQVKKAFMKYINEYKTGELKQFHCQNLFSETMHFHILNYYVFMILFPIM